VNKAELLKAVYGALDWARLYELAPQASRQEVDELFQELRRRLGPQPEGDAAAPVRGGKAVVCCDGASSGNPGPAAIGVVITDADGREVLAWGECIGRATNNVAEYRAAIAGLEKTLELGAKSVELRADSELLVKQLRGQYRVKNAGLKPLHARVRQLLGRFDAWSVAHVPREKNARADALAASALKKARRRS